jgi:hypothetical protein
MAVKICLRVQGASNMMSWEVFGVCHEEFREKAVGSTLQQATGCAKSKRLSPFGLTFLQGTHSL